MRDTIISNNAMKTKTIIWVSVLFTLFVLVLVAANFISRTGPSQNSVSGSLLAQITPTLLPDGLSEIGSTDGILIMGLVIALIAMISVFIYRKRN
jgi:hypothetical protein